MEKQCTFLMHSLELSDTMYEQFTTGAHLHELREAVALKHLGENMNRLHITTGILLCGGHTYLL